MHHSYYMATPEEKELQDKTYVMRIGQRQGQQGIVLHGQTAFSVIINFMVAENGKTWSGRVR